MVLSAPTAACGAWTSMGAVLIRRRRERSMAAPRSIASSILHTLSGALAAAGAAQSVIRRPDALANRCLMRRTASCHGQTSALTLPDPWQARKMERRRAASLSHPCVMYSHLRRVERWLRINPPTFGSLHTPKPYFRRAGRVKNAPEKLEYAVAILVSALIFASLCVHVCSGSMYPLYATAPHTILLPHNLPRC